jgi:hypothetical protein
VTRAAASACSNPQAIQYVPHMVSSADPMWSRARIDHRPAANWATPPKNAAISNIVAGEPFGVPHHPSSQVLTTMVEAKNPNRPSVAGGAIGVRRIRAGGAPSSWCPAPSRQGERPSICAIVRPSLTVRP